MSFLGQKYGVYSLDLNTDACNLQRPVQRRYKQSVLLLVAGLTGCTYAAITLPEARRSLLTSWSTNYAPCIQAPRHSSVLNAVRKGSRPAKIADMPEGEFQVNVDEKELLLAAFRRRLQEQRMAEVGTPLSGGMPVLKRPVKGGGSTEVSLAAGSGSQDLRPDAVRRPTPAAAGYPLPLEDTTRTSLVPGPPRDARDFEDAVLLQRPVPKPPKGSNWDKPQPKTQDDAPRLRKSSTTSEDTPALLQRPAAPVRPPAAIPATTASEDNGSVDATVDAMPTALLQKPARAAQEDDAREAELVRSRQEKQEEQKDEPALPSSLQAKPGRQVAEAGAPQPNLVNALLQRPRRPNTAATGGVAAIDDAGHRVQQP